MGVKYATRESILEALDIKLSSRSTKRIDRNLESTSRKIDDLLRRKYYPQIGTRYFEYPSHFNYEAYRLWLRQNEVLSITTLTSGGVEIPSTDYFLEPSDSGPPYESIEIDRSSDSIFQAGDTPQRSISIEGIFGANNSEELVATTSGVIASSHLYLTFGDASELGVGDTVHIEDEYLFLTERYFVDSTQNIQADLANSKAETTVAVTDGSTFFIGERVLVNAERMLIVDVVGNNLVVRRAWDGTVLGSHTNGDDLYVDRQFRVSRGELGTIAASHADGLNVYKLVFPGPIRSLCIAETLDLFAQEESGYARTIGEGEGAQEHAGKGLNALRKEVKREYGRKEFVWSV